MWDLATWRDRSSCNGARSWEAAFSYSPAQGDSEPSAVNEASKDRLRLGTWEPRGWAGGEPSPSQMGIERIQEFMQLRGSWGPFEVSIPPLWGFTLVLLRFLCLLLSTCMHYSFKNSASKRTKEHRRNSYVIVRKTFIPVRQSHYLVLQLRKLWLRKIKLLAQDHSSIVNVTDFETFCFSFHNVS